MIAPVSMKKGTAIRMKLLAPVNIVSERMWRGDCWVRSARRTPKVSTKPTGIPIKKPVTIAIRRPTVAVSLGRK